MTRGRILTFLSVLGLTVVGLTVLMASRASGDKPGEPPASGSREMKLVCWGDVDTEDRIVGIFPENFPMPSRVKKVLVVEGAHVKKDQPLLELDNEHLQLKVQEAADAIAIAEAEKAKAEAMVRAHSIQVNALEQEWQGKQAELENKQNEFKVTKRAVEVEGRKNQLDLDTAQAAVKAAEFNLSAAKIKLDGLRTEVPNYLVNIADKNIARMRTLKSQAEQARDLMSCKAPADGKIIRSFVDDGANFGPQTREPAFWFLKKGPLLVRAEVTQEFARRISVGKSAFIEDEADPSQTWTGTVTKVGEQFLPKRHGGNTIMDLMPVSDDRVLECLISINIPAGGAGPKYGQKVRVTLE